MASLHAAGGDSEFSCSDTYAEVQGELSLAQFRAIAAALGRNQKKKPRVARQCRASMAKKEPGSSSSHGKATKDISSADGAAGSRCLSRISELEVETEAGDNATTAAAAPEDSQRAVRNSSTPVWRSVPDLIAGAGASNSEKIGTAPGGFDTNASPVNEQTARRSIEPAPAVTASGNATVETLPSVSLLAGKSERGASLQYITNSVSPEFECTTEECCASEDPATFSSACPFIEHADRHGVDQGPVATMSREDDCPGDHTTCDLDDEYEDEFDDEYEDDFSEEEEEFEESCSPLSNAISRTSHIDSKAEATGSSSGSDSESSC
jgi:hypothetical protein